MNEIIKGFIHSKTLLCDYVLSIGSCTFDNRSFKLNFEATALVYSSKEIDIYKKTFIYDISNSIKLKVGRFGKIKYFLAGGVYFLLGKIF